MPIHPALRNTGPEYWITIVLFSCLIILAWVKVAFPKKLPLVVREVFTNQLAYEEKSITPSSVALFAVFICCSALFMVQAIHNYGITIGRVKAEEFGLIVLGLVIFYLVKSLIVFFTGFIFQEQSSAWEYISEIYIFAHFLGVVLLPVMIINAYTGNIDHKLFVEIVGACIALLFLFRTIKMFILMINKGLRVMYLFLYICALEILPLALFIRYGILNL